MGRSIHKEPGNTGPTNRDQQLREHVLYLLRGGGAHLDFEKAIAGLPADKRGAKPPGVPHSPWRLLEHMRICQWDIVQYCVDPQHVSPEFPGGYWPPDDAPPSEQAWAVGVEGFRADLRRMAELVGNPEVDLLAPLPHGEKGHTVLREALLAADHNAYHLGQMVAVRRALGAWPEE
ncbi:MAG: DinB family protein [Planctomycetes bacterium]|nr:DinB family protein [Planctomycetota bacterium]